MDIEYAFICGCVRVKRRERWEAERERDGEGGRESASSDSIGSKTATGEARAFRACY